MILFRCDANPQLGFGHLMRCRQLAAELVSRGHQVSLYGIPREYVCEADERLFTHWQTAKPWTSSERDAQALLAYGADVSAKAYVIDDFRVDQAYQLIMRDAGAHWLQIDSRTDRYLWPDMLLSAHSAAVPEDFQRVLCNPDTTLLVGTRYALLQPQFKNLPPRSTEEEVSNILVTFGGGSDRGAFEIVLNELLPVTDCRFTLVSGANNPNNGMLYEMVDQYPDRMRLHIMARNMADLMFKADLAIMAAGTTALEAAAAGLPMILLAIADNQIVSGKGWQARGGADYLGGLDQVSGTQITDAYGRLKSPAARQAYTEALYQAEIDGQGTTRVAKAIEQKLIDSK